MYGEQLKKLFSFDEATISNFKKDSLVYKNLNDKRNEI